MADAVGLGAQAPSLQQSLAPIGSLLDIQTKQQQVKQQQFATQSGYAQKTYELISGLLQDKRIQNAADDPSKANEALAEAITRAEGFGVPKAQAMSFAAPFFSVAQHAPGNLSQVMQNTLQGIGGAQGLASQNLLPASGQQQIVTDALGRQFVQIRNQSGDIIGTRPLPQGAGQGGAVNIRPTETPDSIKQMLAERNLSQNAVQPSLNGLQNISKIREALPLAETGSYAKLRSTIQSLGGNIAGDSKAELAAAAYDIINKNIEDLGLQKSGALGAQFASQMQSIKDTLPNADKNPTAIKSALDQLEPILQHVQNYSKGLEATLSNKNDIQYKRDYDTKMNQVYDPMVLQAYNVYKNKGALEAQKFIKQHNMNPQDTATKMQNYSDLVNKGL